MRGKALYHKPRGTSNATLGTGRNFCPDQVGTEILEGFLPSPPGIEQRVLRKWGDLRISCNMQGVGLDDLGNPFQFYVSMRIK